MNDKNRFYQQNMAILRLPSFKFTSIYDVHELTLCDSDHQSIVITNNTTRLITIVLGRDNQCTNLGSGDTTGFMVANESVISMYAYLNGEKNAIYREKIENRDYQLTITE